MINKEVFLATLSCPTYGWLLGHSPTQKSVCPAEQLRIEEGLEVHNRARGLLPQGVMVSGSRERSAEMTEQLLSDRNTRILFEATFIHNNFVARADVLIRKGSQWQIVEVKSNVNDDEELIDDLSYTVFVAQGSGLPISACSLLLVNKDYRLGMSDENLCVEIDHTPEALERAVEYDRRSDDITRILSGHEEPIPELRWECKSCDVFDKCCGKGVDNRNPTDDPE